MCACFTFVCVCFQGLVTCSCIRLLVGVSYLEAVLELFAHKVKDNWIYAGVDSCEVDAEVIQDQEETAEIKSVRLG